MAMTLEQAYELGWRRSAEWSKRDDLLSDIDSPAYRRDRDKDLAHLSAQAKAQVTDEAIESAYKKYWDVYWTAPKQKTKSYSDLKPDYAPIRAALEDFAARLSQGAQSSGNSGEVAQVDVLAWRFLYRPTLDQDFSTEGRQWTDGSPDVDAEMRGRDPRRWKIQLAYSHPAERAAVPEGLIREVHAALGKMIAKSEDTDTDEIDVLSRLSDALSAAPTLAGKGGDGHG